MKQSTINQFIAILCMAVFLSACTGKSGKPKEPATSTDTTKQPPPDEPPVATTAAPKLICKDMGTDSLGTPHFDVFLVADGKETKVKSINGCNEITKDQYKTHEIPNDAISACGGWWAGAGDYYYIVMKDGKLTVFEGWQDESQKDKGFHWKAITVK